MLQILIYFFIGISLSMDAFSLALSLGTTSPSKIDIIKTSLTVGIFHFIMPILGSILGSVLLERITFPTRYILFIIFFSLTIQMLINKTKEEELPALGIISIIIFAFSVSIDSFTVGIALGITKEEILLSSSIFSCVSASFTYLGLLLGKKMRNKYEKIAQILGIILMLLVSLKYLIIG